LSWDKPVENPAKNQTEPVNKSGNKKTAPRSGFDKEHERIKRIRRKPILEYQSIHQYAGKQKPVNRQLF
jgi:hypothetical protein